MKRHLLEMIERRLLLAAAPMFDAQRYSFEGAYPQSVATGDFDEDGYADIATTYTDGSSSGGVRILLNNGAGGFTEGAVIPTHYPRRTLEAADFDSDGHLDLLTQEEPVTGTGPSYNILLWGRGDGTFESGVEVFGARAGALFDIGDFNNDDRPDIVLGSAGSTSPLPVAVIYGNGTRTLAAPLEIATPTVSSTAAVGDFNADSRDDIAIAGTTYLNDGAGGFTVVSGSGLPSPSIYYDVADLNGDLRDDVVAVSFVDVLASALLISLSNGDGTFSSSSTAVDLYVHDVVLADLDDDGTLDIGAAIVYEKHFALFPGEGDGTFGAPVLFGNGNHYSWTLAADDFNNDGKSDLAFAQSTLREPAGSVSVVLSLPSGGLGYAQSFSGNMARPTLSADFNEDDLTDLIYIARTGSQVGVQLATSPGVFGPASYIPFISTPASIAVGDFNGDGHTDFAVAGSGYSAVHLGNGAGAFTAVPISSAGSTRIAVGDFNDDGVDDPAFLGSDVLIASHVGGDAFAVTPVTVAGAAMNRIAAGDFDGDAKDDLVVGGGEIVYRLLRRTGANTFAAPVSQTLPGWQLAELGVDDLNFDGRADLLASVRTVGTSPVNRVRIHAGRADGTLEATATLDVAGSAFATGDFDGDGRIDLAYPYTVAVIGGSSGRVAIHRGRDDGTFAPQESFALNDVPGFIHAADLNADGRLDLVLTSNALIIPGQTPRGESILFNRLGADTTPLSIRSAALDLETAQRVALVLDEPVNGLTVSVDDLVATHLGSGQAFTPTGVAITHNGTRVTFTFINLPDGDYSFALPAGAMADAAGNASLAYTLSDASTFIMAGDITHDRRVNFDDLLVLAKRYGMTGQTHSQGNIDYSADGLVGFGDLLLLAQRYGTTLVTNVTAASTKRRRGSLVDL